MTAVRANGITIEYDEIGRRDAPVILLIMGLGMQLVAWPESFCEGLAARGFRVVRFDNRDVGLSTRMPSAGSLATTAMMARAFLGLPVRPPYTLDDMARDTVGLMDALGIGEAHVVGASMGGMIAQIVADRASRTRQEPHLDHVDERRPRSAGPEGQGAARAACGRARATRRRPSAATWRLFRLIGGAGYPPTEAELRARVERAVRRSYRPDGFARQLLAIQTAPSRAPMLRRVRRADPGSARLRRSAGADGRGRAHRGRHPRRPLARRAGHGPLSARGAGSAACR